MLPLSRLFHNRLPSCQSPKRGHKLLGDKLALGSEDLVKYQVQIYALSLYIYLYIFFFFFA